MSMDKTKYWLLAILVAAGLFRAIPMLTPDLVTDDSLYSFRALGWYDYLGGDQASPISWFGEIPWWANLSLNVAAPVGFAVQKIFFTLFGDTVFAARVPFVLSGVVTVFLLYALLALLFDRRTGLLGAAILAVLPLHVWGSVIGYLEGIEVMFIVASAYFFVRYLKTEQLVGLLWCAVFAGLAIMTKYTALFLLPLYVVHLLIFKRNTFKTAHPWFAAAALVVTLFPVIMYNYFMYQTRGHFDAALSSIVGMQPEDFSAIAARTDRNFIEGFLGVARALTNSLSLLTLLGLTLGVVIVLWVLIRRRPHAFESRVLIGEAFIFTFVILAAGGLAENRFLIIIAPWVAALVAVGIAYLFEKNVWLGRFFYQVSFTLVGCVAAISIVAHFTPFAQPYVVPKFLPALSSSAGFNQLDSYLRREILPGSRILERPKSIDAMSKRVSDKALTNKTVFFFDDSINWFASKWYVERYSTFYGIPLASLFTTVQQNGTDVINRLRGDGIETFYFVLGRSDAVVDPEKQGTDYRRLSLDLAAALESQGFFPTEIKNRHGEVAFAIYKFP